MNKKERTDRYDIDESEVYQQSYRRRYSIEFLTLAFLIAFLGLLLIIAFLLFLSSMFPVLLVVYAVAFGVLPGIGVGFLLVKLWKYIHKVQVIEVGEVGTIVRLPKGNLQIVSSQELYAFETKDAKVIPPSMPVYDSLAFPEAFPVQIPVSAGNRPETVPETVPETAFSMDNALLVFEQETQAIRDEMLAKEDVILVNRIIALHKAGMSLRTISKIVKLEGRKYDRFKRLCAEAGIDAS